jgi:hypothetical protein
MIIAPASIERCSVVAVVNEALKAAGEPAGDYMPGEEWPEV